MRRRVLIIANPAAGGGRGSRRRLNRVIAHLQDLGCRVEVRLSRPADGDAERLAREAAPQCDIVVAAGGDGTANAVANAIAGSTTPLAVLPFGTANVLAHEIGLPRRPERLADLIARGTAIAMWPGQVGGRVFLTTASSGFDAATVAAVDPGLKSRFGRLAFAVAIARCLRRYRASPLSVSIDGREYGAATVIAANGRFYAGRFMIAVDARLDQPLLEFLLFQRSGRRAVLGYLLALALGRIPRHRGIIRVRGRAALVAAEAMLPVQADGEIVGHLPAAFGIAPHPLLLLRP